MGTTTRSDLASGGTSVVLRAGSDLDFSALVRVWRSAVDATHAFLSDEDRRSIENLLASDYLPAVRLTVADRDGKPVAFAGTSEGRLEMLFVDDAYRGHGIGTALLEHVRRADGVTDVDVNEQNSDAVTFYESRGFVRVGRSDLDGAGRPYPILHMVRPSE